jgi:hypothetical protein
MNGERESRAGTSQGRAGGEKKKASPTPSGVVRIMKLSRKTTVGAPERTLVRNAAPRRRKRRRGTRARARSVASRSARGAYPRSTRRFEAAAAFARSARGATSRIAAWHADILRVYFSARMRRGCAMRGASDDGNRGVGAASASVPCVTRGRRAVAKARRGVRGGGAVSAADAESRARRGRMCAPRVARGTTTACSPRRRQSDLPTGRDRRVLTPGESRSPGRFFPRDGLVTESGRGAHR